MNVLQFIASLTASLAWPLVALIFVLTQKSPISRMIERVKNAKLFGAEIGIGEEIEAIRQQADLDESVIETLPTVPDDETAQPTLVISHDIARLRALEETLAKTSATGTIIAAWADLEDGLRAIAHGLGKSWRANNFGRNLADLRELGIVERDTLDGIRSLRQLRNEIAHGRGGEPTLQEANAYRDTAKDIISKVGMAAGLHSWR